MKNIVIKDLFREIRKSAARFISIFGIVLVGVAFFTGVKSSAPYMKNSADSYYDRTNFYDLRVYSENGLSDSDIDTLRDVTGVESVEGANIMYAVSEIDTSERVIQIMSIGDNNTNTIEIVSGRLPSNKNECVLRDYEMKKTNLFIGDSITVHRDDGTFTGNFTITGYVSTPYYLSYQYDKADVGSGETDTIMFVNDGAFDVPVYQTAYIGVKDADSKNTYSGEYFTLTDAIKDRIQSLGYTVLDRKSHYSYVEYQNCSDRMDAIAKVFPIFFYLVAALVCLTTMTRMVDEERQNIGTMKALGYSKGKIAFKYLMYAILASLGGSICGCFVGLMVFPRIIFNAWNIVYTVDRMTPDIQYVTCILAVIIAVMVTLFATLFACVNELMESPTLLLRPKAPKNGKKILLEKITIIWKRFNLTSKVTARNLFRYKKRFFMTTVGIAGCTALILAGFGIKNSVSTIVNRQYSDIFGYDLDCTMNMNITSDAKNTLYNDLISDDRIESAYIYSEYQFQTDNSKDVNLISVDNAEEYSKVTTLYDVKYKSKVIIPKDGALISYKLAKDLSLTTGDYIDIKYNNNTYQVKIAGIISMYVRQYLFMSDDYFTSVFNETPNKKLIAVDLNIIDEDEQKEMGSELIDKYNLEGVNYYTGITEKFEDMISSLDIITLVLIVSAALLAFIVLYNLINVNISERIREIATIKVLGFYDNEVERYVYRENIILCMTGALAGLLLGGVLHSYIMNVIEMDDVIFPKVIFWYSYIMAFIITIVFGLMVNIFMNRKLKKIKMVESLKSIE